MEYFDVMDPENPGKYLRETLICIEKRFGVVITIHDCRGLLYSKSGEHIFEDHRRHTHPFCTALRYSMPFWHTYCNRSCLFEAESLAREAFRPYLHKCWKGGTELIVPGVRNGSLVFLMYAGVFRETGETPPEILPKSVKQEFCALKELDRETLEQLSRVLFTFGQSVIYCSTELCRKEDRRRMSSRRHEIRRFLTENAHGEVVLEDLAAYLALSPSRTSHLVKKLFTVPFRSLLEDERMTRAKNMLLNTEMPLKTIAGAVGFRNVFYFSQVFRKHYGIPPGRFRQTHCTGSHIKKYPAPGGRRV